ncbi:MAG: hypothetical protein IJG53_01385 [Eggerthellaceae bacterium]|nr:hypothetical protein [Eggerthellaceae bacterium]
MTGTPTGNGFGEPSGASLNAKASFTARNRVNHVLYYLIQWTWGLPQNLAGLVLMAVLRARNPQGRIVPFHGSVVVPWNRAGGSMTLGMFIFFGHRSRKNAAAILVHEYGHTIQSCILGPAYLLVIGLPSLIWAWLPALRRRREEGLASYFDFYPERWANYAGARVTHRPAPKR